LGHFLTPAEFQHCLNQVKFITPKVGKFWQGTEVEPGIYIVIAGKVRLLDAAGELIASLEAGAAFGQFTLFPDAQFPPYAARASVNLHLCFVPGEVLLPLMAKYTQIREHLWDEAFCRNPGVVDSDLIPVRAERIVQHHNSDIFVNLCVRTAAKKD